MSGDVDADCHEGSREGYTGGPECPPVAAAPEPMEAATTPRPAVLVVEDEQNIRELVCLHLGLENYDCVECGDGESALKLARSRHFDLVILDVMLPGLDGVTVCRALRRESDNPDVPVLMLTARREESDKVVGLESGADDYLTKPFGNAELLARVQALLRRQRSEAPEPDVYDDGQLQVVFLSREVRVEEKPVALTPIEFRLLAALVRHAGQVLSPEQLLEQAWNDPLRIGPDRVKFSVLRLRKKLGWHRPGSPIEAVRGFGYRYVPPAR